MTSEQGEEQTPLLADTEADLEQQQQQPSRRPLYHGRGALDSEEEEDEAGDSDDETAAAAASGASLSKSHRRRSPRVTLKSILYTLLLTLICATLLALALTHLIFGRLLSRVLSDPHHAGPRMAQAGLITHGPYHAELLHSTDAGVDVELSFFGGVDVRRALEAEGEGEKWSGMWRWASRRAGHVRVDVSAADVRVHRATGQELLALAVADPVLLPLSYGGVDDVDVVVEEVKMRVRVGVSAPEEVVKLALEAWEREEVGVSVEVPRVDVSVGGKWMRKTASVSLEDLVQPLAFKVPQLDFLRDPSQLVTLTDYTVKPAKNKQLTYTASATVENPLVSRLHDFPQNYIDIIQQLSNQSFSLPWPVAADAYLLDPSGHHQQQQQQHPVHFSRAQLQPFDLALKQPLIQLQVQGRIDPDADADELDPALSTLLTHYLAGESTPFKVHPVATPSMPAWLAEALQPVPLIALSLPGSPDPNAQLLENVGIQHMRIDGTGPHSEILVSGTVVGDVVFPAGLESLAEVVELRKLWPDVLVFDGAPSWTANHAEFPPEPLPPRAFARLRPQEWSAVDTRPEQRDDGQTVLKISTQLDGVPMSVLPGRSDLFRSYVSKVLFGAGDGPEGQVRTGIWGFADAKVELEPLGKVGLDNVLVQGEFFVSKSGIFNFFS